MSACRTKKRTGTGEAWRGQNQQIPKERRQMGMKAMATCNTKYSDSSKSNEDLYSLFHIKENRTIQVDVVLEEEPVTMQLDTGPAVAVMSKTQYNKLLRKRVKLQLTAQELYIYTGETVKIIDVCQLNVEYDQQSTHMPLYVLEGNGSALFGRNWLKQIRQN